MTYLDAALNLDSMYQQHAAEVPSRYLFLARMANAISKVNNAVTDETVGNLRVLSTKVQSWAQTNQESLTQEELSKLTWFSNLLLQAHDAFVLTLSMGVPVEDVFSTPAENFDQVLESLQGYNQSAKQLDAFALDAPRKLDNCGNIFPFVEYVDGKLRMYAQHPDVDNEDTLIKGYALCTSMQVLAEHSLSVINLIDRLPQASALFIPVLEGITKVLDQKYNGPFAVVFRSAPMYNKSEIPFRYTQKNVSKGEIKTGTFTDKLAQIKVFTV